MKSNALFGCIFGVFFIGFALFWMAAAARVASIMSLFGLIFVIAGIFIIYKNVQRGRGFGIPLSPASLDPASLLRKRTF